MKEPTASSARLDLNVSGELLDPELAAARASALAEVELHLFTEKQIATAHFLGTVYAKGRDYSNFIIAGGYAAFLTVWAGVRDDIAPAYRLLSGGLLAVSLMAFISWELVKMVSSQKDAHDLADAVDGALDREDLARRIEQAVAMARAREILLHGMWALPFYIAVASGLVGAALLAIATLTTGTYLAKS